MRQGRRASTRIGIAALVLAAHVLLIQAWWWGSRAVPSRIEPVPQYVSVWPDERRPEPPVAVAERVQAKPPASRTAITTSPAPPRPDPSRDVPSEGIGAPDELSAPGVDWAGEAALAAQRQSEARGAPATFSEPPPKPREPCRVKPWKWKPEEKRAGIAPLPYVVIGKRCIIGLGFFGCSLGEPAEVASDQLDDYKNGDGAGPSVPDPNVCD